MPPEHRIRSPAPPPHPPGHRLPVGRGQPQARAVAGAAPYGAGASPPPRLGRGATAGLRLRTAPLLKRGREHDAEARKPDEGGSDRWDRVAGWRVRKQREEHRENPKRKRLKGRVGGKRGRASQPPGSMVAV